MHSSRLRVNVCVLKISGARVLGCSCVRASVFTVILIVVIIHAAQYPPLPSSLSPSAIGSLRLVLLPLNCQFLFCLILFLLSLQPK